MTLFQLVAMLLTAAAALCAIMSAAWFLQQRTGNSGWVDVSWSLGVGTVACLLTVWPLQPGWPHWRQLAVAVLILAWGLRLGLHIARRTQAVADDPRYRDLIVQWGADAPRRMFWFLQSQAAVGAVLVLSVALAAQNPNPDVRLQDLLAGVVLVGALIGEGVADRQLARFKRATENRGAICDVGLWSLSRHPNYFFEWLGWLSYPIAAIDMAGHNIWGPLALAAPACMYWILVHVSGIPPLEQHMLRARGEAYRAYQRRTRPFLPLPR